MQNLICFILKISGNFLGYKIILKKTKIVCLRLASVLIS